MKKLLFFVPFLLFASAFCDSSEDVPHENVNELLSLSVPDNSSVPGHSSNNASAAASQLPQARNVCSVQPAGARVVQVCPGIRAGSFRYHIGDGYFYHRQRSSYGRTYLRCALQRSSPPCLVRAVMDDDLSNFRITAGVHNHGPDQFFDRVIQLRASLLEACRVRPNVRVELIYHDVCRNVARNVSTRVPLLSIRPTMVRTQSENRPIIPHSFQELANTLHINGELSTTLDGEENIFQGLSGEPGYQSIVFMSRRVLIGVGPIQNVFCDGTFYARPNMPDSSQLFTIVTIRDNHIVPLVHALMESRTYQAYQALLTFLRNLAPTMNPTFIMTDFEQALQSALREAFPRARLTGCLWHYTRAVCRQVRSLGLQQTVSNNENALRIVRLCMAIPLAPPGRLQEALNAIVIEARRLLLFNEFTGFFDYIRNTWINGVGDATLSVFGVRHRTNNVAECHHRNMNARLVRRPNIWRFLEMLRESEDTAWRDLARLEEGYAPSRARRVSTIMSDNRIRSCSRQVMHNEMQMIQFLSTVSWRLEGTLRDFFQEMPDDRPASPERGPPPDQLGGNSDGVHLSTSGQVYNLHAEHDIDPDLNAQLLSLNGSTMVPTQPRQQPGNTRSRVDDMQLYESLMEDANIDPDDPMPLQSRRGRGSRRARGRGAGRGANRGRRATANVNRRSTRSTHCPSDSSAGGSAPVSNGIQGTCERGTSNAVQRPCNQNIQDSGIRPLPAVSGTACNRNSNAGSCNINLRPENFSDEEELPEEEGARRQFECIICNSRVGNYAMLTCGATPLCGACLRHWFVNLRNNRCPHCGGPVQGWIRLRRL